MNYFMNNFVNELLPVCLYVDELLYEMYMLQLNDEWLWDYNVDVVIVVDVVKSSMSYVVVDVVIVVDVVKSLKLYVVVD